MKDKVHGIKAVLFDMDGVIVDTEKVYQRFWYESAIECGCSEFTKEDALILRSGWQGYVRPIMKDKFGDTFDYTLIHDKCALYTKEYLEKNGIEIKPGVYEVLSYLKETQMKVALVTSGDLKIVVPRLKKLKLYEFFDVVVSAHELDRGKPFPDPYIYASQKIGVKPEEVFAIEDSPNGIKSALEAGCNTIMIPDLTGPEEEWQDKLYACLEDLFELKTMLKK